jgi:hypothetical protein
MQKMNTRQTYAVIKQNGTKAVVTVDVFERLSDAKHLYDQYRDDYLRLYKDGIERFKERMTLSTATLHTPKTPRYIVETVTLPQPWETEYRVLDTSQQNSTGTGFLELTNFLSKDYADTCCAAFNAKFDAEGE